MPFARAILRAPTAGAVALARFAIALSWAVVIGIGLFALLLLLVRLVVFPHIERYRDDIAAAIAAQVHQPVALDTLTTGWDGWNPKLVIDGFRMGAAIAGAPPVLELPRVELTVSWTSVPLLELRLKQLLIESPRLAIRRDERGIVHLAGIEIDPEQQTDDSGVSDWLLRQREIVVRNALITWTDERRNAAQLVLDRVNFRLESHFGRRRFGLTGSPPSELAAPIDVRGDLVAPSLREWQQAAGQVYVRLDYADVGAWREWLPLPLDIESGKGALRGWFTFEKGEAREIIADLELADVRTRLQDDLPPLALAHLAGRAGWRFAPPTREVFCRQLAFTTAEGLTLEPTNVSLLLHASPQGAPEKGRLEFDRLQLGPLQAIAAHLPLPERWRAELRAFAPTGQLARGLVQWDGAVDAPTAYEFASEFAQLGVRPHGDWPGVANLAGSLKATRAGGEMRLDARDARLDLPGILAQAVALESMRGDIAWTRDAQERVSLRVKDVVFANADVAGKVQATYRTLERGPGDIDLEASVSRVALRVVAALHPGVPQSRGASMDRRRRAARHRRRSRSAPQGRSCRVPVCGGQGWRVRRGHQGPRLRACVRHRLACIDGDRRRGAFRRCRCARRLDAGQRARGATRPRDRHDRRPACAGGRRAGRGGRRHARLPALRRGQPGGGVDRPLHAWRGSDRGWAACAQAGAAAARPREVSRERRLHVRQQPDQARRASPH